MNCEYILFVLIITLHDIKKYFGCYFKNLKLQNLKLIKAMFCMNSMLNFTMHFRGRGMFHRSEVFYVGGGTIPQNNYKPIRSYTVKKNHIGSAVSEFFLVTDS